MTLRLVVKPRLCTGCRTCEMACAFSHGKDGQPAASRCQTVTTGKDEHVPMMCLQCDNAACALACPVGAIARDPVSEVVRVDQARCIRCKACVVACPFGNMHFDPALQLVHKCDLCAGCGDVPRCAMFCPTKCLTVDRPPA